MPPTVPQGPHEHTEPVSGSKADPKLSCGCRQSGRNLVVCMDGTSNRFGLKNTNVVELYSHLVKDDKQLTYYNSGIGTYAKPSFKSWAYWKQVFNHKLDLAIAWQFERRILDAYEWLSEQYRDGDRIFLFGFSRGAYQVRALSAMIDQMGLIEKGNAAQIAFAYELYTAINVTEPATSDFDKRLNDLGVRLQEAVDKAVDAVDERGTLRLSKPEHEEGNALNTALKDALKEALDSALDGTLSTAWVAQKKKELDERNRQLSPTRMMAAHFKNTFSRVVKVHFIGAWDTVSSVGIVRDKTLPLTASGLKHACFFRHALALDERRVKFLPEYAYGGTTDPSPAEILAQADGARSTSNPHPFHTKEVWFAGTHSDIGGGNTDNLSMDHSGPPLRWMAYEAISQGIRLNPFRGEWSLEKLIDVNESLRGPWHIFEWLPIKRLSYKDSTSITWRPQLGAGRRIQPSQKLHSSVFLAKAQAPEYTPHARFTLGKKNVDAWNELRNAWGGSAQKRNGADTEGEKQAQEEQKTGRGPTTSRTRTGDDTVFKNLLNKHSILLEEDLYDFVVDLVTKCRKATSKHNFSEVETDLRYALSTYYGRRALQEAPKATEVIAPVFWQIFKSELLSNCTETTKAKIVVSVEPDITMFGILLEHSNRWPEDSRTVAFVSSTDARDAELQFQLQLRRSCIPMKVLHAINPPLDSDPSVKSMSVDSDVCFPRSAFGVHSFVQKLDRYLQHLYYLPETRPLQDAIDVKVLDLTSASRHIQRADQVRLEGNNEGYEQVRYGLQISNKHTEQLYIAVFTFHVSDWSIQKNYSTPEKKLPLEPGQSIEIGQGAGVPLAFYLYTSTLDIAYLKIYLSTSYIDPASLASDEYDWNSSTRKSTIPPGQVWDAVTIPIIELREGVLGPSGVHADADIAPTTSHDDPAPSGVSISSSSQRSIMTEG